MRGIASAATSVVIGYIANSTSTIRVGSGGIMLPNHSPLVIAEQFGTLASLYPNRIDLGLGRAPGTDQLTSYALRRTLSTNVEDFPRDVMELQYYFKEAKEGQRVVAVPGEGTNVPIYILGSSLYGAQLAAKLGLPFAFASHFAPQNLNQAVDIYRSQFEPSDQLDKPYFIAGYNIFGAHSLDEANYLRSSSLQSFLNLRKGNPGKLPPPIKNFEDKIDLNEKTILSHITSCYAAGTKTDLKKGIKSFVNQTQANELMLVSPIFDHKKRLNSFKIASESISISKESKRTLETLSINKSLLN
tara:strand:- start:1207 stop:2109 length:903 start_codon:yes stop_codon:yes gene_type:complete